MGHMAFVFISNHVLSALSPGPGNTRQVTESGAELAVIQERCQAYLAAAKALQWLPFLHPVFFSAALSFSHFLMLKISVFLYSSYTRLGSSIMNLVMVITNLLSNRALLLLKQ